MEQETYLERIKKIKSSRKITNDKLSEMTGIPLGTLSKLLTNIGMPFMILSSTMKLEFSGEFTKSIIVAGVVGVLFTVAMFLMSALIVRGESDTKRRGMMRFCMVFANNGFIGIPLAMAVFSRNKRALSLLFASSLSVISETKIFFMAFSIKSGSRGTA